jgi:hypothetical protein
MDDEDIFWDEQFEIVDSKVEATLRERAKNS